MGNLVNGNGVVKSNSGGSGVTTANKTLYKYHQLSKSNRIVSMNENDDSGDGGEDNNDLDLGGQNDDDQIENDSESNINRINSMQLFFPLINLLNFNLLNETEMKWNF